VGWWGCSVLEQVRNAQAGATNAATREAAVTSIRIAPEGVHEAEQAYGERHYAITVARVDGNVATVVSEDVRELSPESVVLLRRAWQGEEVVAQENAQAILNALAVSDDIASGDLAQVDVFTMKDTQLVALTADSYAEMELGAVPRSD